MSLDAQYDQSCKVCKVEIKKGDKINKLETPYPHWCKNPKCGKTDGFENETTTQKKTVSMSATVEEPKTVEVKDPFTEAELIVKWARNKAMKIALDGVENWNGLTVQEKNGKGQEIGMVTRALIDTTLKLFEINEVKSQYYEGPGKKVIDPKE